MSNWYRRVWWPFLKRMDAERAHELTLMGLGWAQGTPIGRGVLGYVAGDVPHQRVTVAGLTFANAVGVAAGLDKDVRVARGLGLLGFGHVEVGTLTPRPQVGNVKPRIFRLPKDMALINRMGFPNGGAVAALPRLKKLARDKGELVVGVSVGKQKETPLAKAVDDYIFVLRLLYEYADYVAVNISSPNTPGLRELQGGDYVGHLLGTLAGESEMLARKLGVARRPLFLKIAPDLDEDELAEIVTAAHANCIDGLIATNTTLARPALRHPNRREAGGLSGDPLAERSTAVIKAIRQQSDLPIIGVGGVRTAADVRAKLAAGAQLVQVYSGLVYEGPGLVGRLLVG